MSKIMTMGDAVARFVPHGSSVVMGAALESLIPFAAGHEIIRRQGRDLTLIGPISDILFDFLCLNPAAAGTSPCKWLN